MTSLVLFAGNQRAAGNGSGKRPYRPSLVELSLGARRMVIDPFENGPNPLKVDEAAGLTLTRLTVRLPPTAPELDRCLAELDLQLSEGPWVFGLPVAAVDALPGTVQALTSALRSCDKPSLQKLTRFPLVLRELQGGSGYSLKWFAPATPTTYKAVGTLAQNCNWLVFPLVKDEQMEPSIVGSLAPGLVRVLGNGAAGGPEYWRLAWTDKGWRFVGVDYLIFE